MKKIIIQSEYELVEALQEALVRIESFSPRLVGEKDVSSDDGRLLLELNSGGRVLRLKIVLRLETRIDLIARLIADKSSSVLLATVSLPESLARNCRANGINHVDLNGRIWIREKGLLIDRNVPDPALCYRLAGRDPDFFSQKSCRVARILLSNPGRLWGQSELAKATALSQGLVSRLLNHAAKLGWVEGFRGDWRLTGALALLDAWAEADNWRKRVTLRQYSTYESDLDSLARHVMDELPGDTAFTQWFAANLRSPHTQPPLLSAYRRHLPTAEEKAALGLREVSDGGRLWIILPRDEGVFQAVRNIGGLPVVCDVQIYLDLLQVGLRGSDQAKALREWEGFCKP